jgi:uncharacterized membrane protein YphA (DoxX/SURF4 family)/thiol-disulfide isomerase/thioredoxin
MIKMDLSTVATLILAAMFMVAGIKAFTGRKAYLAMLSEFGVPAALRRQVAVTLTVCELLIGTTLPIPFFNNAAAVAALCLLGCYTCVIAYALISGKRPNCNCFGQLSQKPISPTTLLRNAVFMLLSALIVWREDARVAKLGLDISTSAVLVGGIIVVQAWLLLHLLMQNGRLFLKIDTIEMQLKAAGFDNWAPNANMAEHNGLPIGSLAPDFAIESAFDGKRTLFSRVRDSDMLTVLIFSDAACGPCKDMLPQVARWSRQYGAVLKLLIITTMSDKPAADLYGQLADITYIQNARDAAALYDAAATPSAVIVSREGSVASTLALGENQIRDLILAIVASERSEPAAAIPHQMQVA